MRPVTPFSGAAVNELTVDGYGLPLVPGAWLPITDAGGLYADLWAVQVGDLDSLAEGFRERVAFGDD